MVNIGMYYKEVEYRFESKTEKIAVVYSSGSDRAKIVKTLEPDDFEKRKENEDNKFKRRLQLFDISREYYE